MAAMTGLRIEIAHKTYHPLAGAPERRIFEGFRLAVDPERSCACSDRQASARRPC